MNRIICILLLLGSVAQGQDVPPPELSRAVLDAAYRAVLDYYPIELLDTGRVDAARAEALARLAQGGASRAEVEIALDDFVRAACDDDQALALPQTDSIETDAVLCYRLSRFTLDREDNASAYLRIRDWTDAERVKREFDAALASLTTTQGLVWDLHGFSGDEALWQYLVSRVTDIPLHGAHLHTRIPGTEFSDTTYPDILPATDPGLHFYEPIVFWLDRSWQPALAFASIVQARGAVDFCFDQRGLHSRAANLREIELPHGFRMWLPTATVDLAYDVPRLAPSAFLTAGNEGDGLHHAKWQLREMLWWFNWWRQRDR